jgi:crotonobetainyl-CoA:carnitine CoA-transferase CaiB-like acyl-CoA transferase
VRHPHGETLRLAANPVRFAQGAVRPFVAPPLLGQDTASVLHEAGFDAAAIARLHASGVTAPKPARADAATEGDGGKSDSR